MPTQQEIADHLGMNQSEVSRHMAKLDLDWKAASLGEIRVTYIRQLRAQAAGHRSDDGMDLVRERVLTERVDRELKMLQVAEKKGALVNVAQLEPELVTMVMAFRTELLSRDDKLAAELSALYGVTVDAALLNEHTYAALSQLARYDIGGKGGGASFGGDAGASGADDDDGLGAGAPPAVGEEFGAAG